MDIGPVGYIDPNAEFSASEEEFEGLCDELHGVIERTENKGFQDGLKAMVLQYLTNGERCDGRTLDLLKDRIEETVPEFMEELAATCRVVTQ